VYFFVFHPCHKIIIIVKKPSLPFPSNPPFFPSFTPFLPSFLPSCKSPFNVLVEPEPPVTSLRKERKEGRKEDVEGRKEGRKERRY
jgi:hypothetical protein